MSLLKPGQIITLDCAWLNKSKFFLVAGVNPDPLLLFISSKIYALAKNNPALLSAQVVVPKSMHPFLSRDSWINCGQVCIEFSWEGIDYQLQNGMGKMHGPIHRDTRNAIMEAVSMSETLSTKHQRIILEALSVDPRSSSP